ncbi:MAG: hypothetical protein ACK4R2_01985 [Roseateles sp.]
MTMATVQPQIGVLHRGVLRTMALMASLDEARVKALREQAQRLAQVVRRFCVR